MSGRKETPPSNNETNLTMKDTIGRYLALFSLGAGLAHGGLISHYTFDETTGTSAQDRGTAGVNGVIGSNVLIGQPGKFGTAFTFKNDTTDAGIVDMGNATAVFNAITTSQKLTISVWLSWTTAGTRDCAVFLGDSTSTNRYLDVGTVTSTTGVYGRVRNAQGTGFSDLSPTPAAALNTGAWHHVAYTLDAATEVAQLYVDGVPVSSGTTTAITLPTIFNNFEVGRLGRSGVTDAYAGSVDELRIYDSVLTAGQIQLLSQGPGGDPSLQISATETFTNNGQATTLVVPFTNGGASQPLVLTEPTPVTISGVDAASFSVSSYDNNLAPGASGALNIAFTPSRSGIHEATLTVASNDSLQSSRQVALSVEVIDPVAVVSPVAIDFGTLDQVTEPQTRTLTISNQGGAAPLNVYSLQLTGNSAFTTDATTPFIVPAGQSANVTVTFTPGSADGRFVASLDVDTDGYSKSFFTIPLVAHVKLANPNESLVSHFTFEDQGALGHDSGLLGNNGTPVGDAQWTSSSRVGTGALLLDGTGDLIDLGAGTGPEYTSGMLSDDDGFTVACWANVPTGTTTDRVRFFSAYANGAAGLAEGWGVGRRNTAGQLIGTTYGRADYLAAAASAPAPGAWHHYAYVFRNVPVNRVDLFVDGALVSSHNATAANAIGLNEAATVGFAIGALGRSTAFEGFHGRLDDLRIYNREMSASNVADLYNSVPPLSGYESWASGYGLDPDGNGGYLENPDQDGLTNSLEYLLGSSPVSGVSADLPEASVEAGHLVFVYPRKKAAVDGGFLDVVEFTDDLADTEWTPAVHAQGGVTIGVTDLDAETEEVTVSIPSSGPRMFARLTVTAPAE